jgi:hypothetical protein
MRCPFFLGCDLAGIIADGSSFVPRSGRHRRFAPPLGIRLIRVALLGLALAASARAHPIHTSLADADYSRATQTLTVALRVFVDDFEAALSAHAGRQLSLAQTPTAEFDTLARAYLAERFTVRTRTGSVVAPRWIGREIKPVENELWFHCEYPLAEGVEGARLRHVALGEQFPNQINSVRIRDGDRKATLVFLPKQSEKTVRFHP